MLKVSGDYYAGSMSRGPRTSQNIRGGACSIGWLERRSVKRFELGWPVSEATAEALQRALELAGVICIASVERPKAGGPGVRLAAS